MRRSMTVREAIFWLSLTCFASSMTLFIVDYGQDVFLEGSTTILTRNLPK